MLDNILRNHTTIITGGTTGIGRAITLSFLTQGSNVAVNHLGLSQDIASLRSLIQEAKEIKENNADAGQMIEVQGDVRDPQTGQTLVERAVKQEGWSGRIDVCVSNAGICRFSDFLDINQALFVDTLNTNLSGAFYVCQAAARQMVDQVNHPASYAPSPSVSAGSIITIASISALIGGAEQVHYTPTKAGCLSLAKSMACALGKYNIRANALLPGEIETQLNSEKLAVSGPEGRRAVVENVSPLGRVGRTKDLAGPALFLACGDLSEYVTGTGVPVDGGLLVNNQYQ